MLYFILFYKKRFCNRKTIRGIWISEWIKSLRFIIMSWDDGTKKRANYLSCIEGKGYFLNYTILCVICFSSIKSLSILPLLTRNWCMVYGLVYNFGENFTPLNDIFFTAPQKLEDLKNLFSFNFWFRLICNMILNIKGYKFVCRGRVYNL